ncbi:MAG: DMT family transporter [Armatimonadota bacterium]
MKKPPRHLRPPRPNCPAPLSRILAGGGYVVAATLLWSTIPICVKFALKALDSYTICWSRFGVGAAVLFACQRLRRVRLSLTRRDAGMIVLAALGIGGNYVMYIRGIHSTTASAGNVVVQFEVVSVVILSYFWLKEQMTVAKVIGMLITFAGVSLALWNGESAAALLASENFFGNMLILIAAPLWAVYAIAQKILADRGFGVSSSLVYIFALAAVLTLPVAIAGFDVHGPFTADVVAALVIVSVFGTALAYVMIGKGFELLDASTAAVITCLLPIFTIVTARVFLREQLSPALAVGAILVVAGILVIGRAEADRSQTPGL